MEFNLLTLVGISLALMFFGYFFGLFEGRAQGAKKHKNQEELSNNAKGIFASPSLRACASERNQPAETHGDYPSGVRRDHRGMQEEKR